MKDFKCPSKKKKKKKEKERKRKLRWRKNNGSGTATGTKSSPFVVQRKAAEPSTFECRIPSRRRSSLEAALPSCRNAALLQIVLTTAQQRQSTHKHCTVKSLIVTEVWSLSRYSYGTLPPSDHVGAAEWWQIRSRRLSAHGNSSRSEVVEWQKWEYFFSSQASTSESSQRPKAFILGFVYSFVVPLVHRLS